MKATANQFWQKHRGLVWSNPNADDSVHIRAALLRPRFSLLLDVAVEFGLERVRREWLELQKDRTREVLRAREPVERILSNIEKGFAIAAMKKLQGPTSKRQRNRKRQAPVSANDVDGVSAYPENSTGYFVLNDAPTPDMVERHPFDLEERTAKFGENIICFVKKVPRTPANDRLVNQLVGCGTSVGANYCEANEAVSKKEFKCIIGRCVKEAKETKFFLRMMAISEPTLADEARVLYREAKELHLIFASIFRK